MFSGDLLSVNAARAKAGIVILLACVLTLSGETWAAPPADPVRDAKSGTATGASVKGMKLKVSTNGRYFGPFKLDPYDHHAALLGA